MSAETDPLPHRPPVEQPDRDTLVVGAGSTEASDLCGLLAAQTAAEVLAILSEAPAVASDLAEATGTSVQNVQYHLDRLEEGGLVEEVDTWYSSRGAEMAVYAPARERVVVELGGGAGDGDDPEGEAPDGPEHRQPGTAAPGD